MLDPALHADAVARALRPLERAAATSSWWSAVQPALDRWEGVKGSRPGRSSPPVSTPRSCSSLDARERGATAAAAVYGVRALAGPGRDRRRDRRGRRRRGAGAELGEVCGARSACPCSAGSRRSSASSSCAVLPARRRAAPIGPRPVKGSERAPLPRGRHLPRLDELLAAAARARLPARPRRAACWRRCRPPQGLSSPWPGGRRWSRSRSRTSTCCRPWGSSSCRSTSRATASCPPASAACCSPGQLDEDQLPPSPTTPRCRLRSPRRRRRAADAGHGRRRAAAAAAPGRQPRPQPRARRRAARPKPSCSNGTTGRATCTPGPTRGNPYDEGENAAVRAVRPRVPRCWSRSRSPTRSAAPASRQAEGFVVGRCLATTLFPSLPRCPALAASFVAAMRLAGPARELRRSPPACSAGAPPARPQLARLARRRPDRGAGRSRRSPCTSRHHRRRRPGAPLQDRPPARRPVGHLGQLLVRRELRRAHVRHRLLLAGAVRPGGVLDGRRGGLLPLLLPPLPARRLGGARPRPRLDPGGGHGRLSGVGPGAVPARHVPHHGRPGPAGARAPVPRGAALRPRRVHQPARARRRRASSCSPRWSRARRRAARIVWLRRSPCSPSCAVRVVLAAVFAAPAWEFHYTAELAGSPTSP